MRQLRTGLLALLALLFVVTADAAPRRRAVAHPLTREWVLEVTTAGGFAPSMRTSITLRSSGAATLFDFRGETLCSGAATAGELAQLAAKVEEAKPEQWAGSYLDPANPNGCCDQIKTTLKLTRGDATYETSWFDDHPPLPADLVALHAAAYGERSPRARLEPACRNTQALQRWSIEITEDGGAAYRYHRVNLGSDKTLYVQPNVRDGACRYTIDAGEAQQLGELVQRADAAAWSASYARADNPNGCCDQIRTKVRVTRAEPGPDGAAVDVTYTTQWFSDHPPLPRDLEELYARLRGDLFDRFAAQCGPLF